MNTSLNWQKLYEEGRCKEVGIFWNDEERKAIHTFKIPADYVRNGVLTLEDYNKELQKELSTGKKPLEKWSMEDLTARAEKFGVKMSTEVTKGTLVKEIKSRTKIAEQKIEQQEALAEAYRKQDKEEAQTKASREKAKDEAKKELVKEDVKEEAKIDLDVKKAVDRVKAEEKK